MNEEITDHDKALYAKGWNACNTAYIREINSIVPVYLEEQVPRWISVEDRLPDIGEMVLVTAGHGCIRDTAWRTCFSKPKGKWDTYGCIDTETIKYWMALPEPPKEDTDGH